jgi:hypothetical protein
VSIYLEVVGQGLERRRLTEAMSEGLRKQPVREP